MTKSCRYKNYLQLQELTVVQDCALALSSEHILKANMLTIKQYYLTYDGHTTGAGHTRVREDDGCYHTVYIMIPILLTCAGTPLIIKISS